MGLACIKLWGFAFLILSHISEISHEYEIIGLTDTKLFHFHRIFKTGGGGGGGSCEPCEPPLGSMEPCEPPLDPLLIHLVFTCIHGHCIN